MLGLFHEEAHEQKWSTAMYRFSLEPSLNHRKFLEEQLQRELAALQRLLMQEQEELLSYYEARDQVLAGLQKKQGEHATVSEILVYLTFLDQLANDLEKKKGEVTEIEDRLEAKRNDLLKAIKKRKSLDRLKERGNEAFRQEENKREQLFVNEVAISQYHRGR